MKLDNKELHILVMALEFEIDQMTDGLQEHVEDYKDEIVLSEKIRLYFNNKNK